MNNQSIYAHPDSIRELLALMNKYKSPAPALLGPDLFSMPIFEDRHLERRRIRQVWHPPEESRFAAYGPEDEVWMRPLGLGRIEQVDEGPAFWLFNSTGPAINPTNAFINAGC